MSYSSPSPSSSSSSSSSSYSSSSSSSSSSCLKVNNITNRSGIAGPTVAGIASVNSNSHFVVPTGRTGQRYADDGENIVRDGLVLYLDAKYSYPSKTGIGTTTAGAAAPAGSSTDVDVNTWYDMSGYENNGELINGVGYNAANGGSLVFDGVNDYVSFNNILGSPSGFSFGFVLNYSSTQSVLFPRILAGVAGVGEMEIENNDYFFRFRWGGVSTDSPNNYIIPNIISNYFITYSSPSVLFYRNGILFDTKTFSSVSEVNFNTIMNRQSSDRPLNGSLYNFSIYNKALTAAEVLQNYNVYKSRFGLS